MTRGIQIEVETGILFIVAAVVGVSFALYSGHRPQLPTKIYLPIMQANMASPSTLTPTPFIPKPVVTTQISPDGTKELSMTVTTNTDSTKTYLFATSNIDGSNQKIVYTLANTTDLMNIPFNTWSPDDVYLFITRNTSLGDEAFVIRADGQPVSETESTSNVTTIFTAKNTGNIYQETTGWASNTLLIVNTRHQDGSKGPSYWVEIPSDAVIELSTQF